MRSCGCGYFSKENETNKYIVNKINKNTRMIKTVAY